MKSFSKGLRLLFLTPLFILGSSQNLLFAQIAIKADTVFTVSGPKLIGGVVLVNKGKIEAVGSANSIKIPASYKVLTAKVVTPGLIDAHSVVGLAGIYNTPHDQDQLELSDAIQPELRAVDAYNGREALVDWVRSFGITTLHTGHAPGALASGQTIIVKTLNGSTENAVIDSGFAVAMTLGSLVGQNFKKPGTRAKGIAMLRTELIKAREYGKKMLEKDASKRPARDLKLEVFNDLLNGKFRALITVHKANDILTAIRLANEFGFKLILDGCAEAPLVLNEIKASGSHVILHATMVRTGGEAKSASMETASKLKAAGIKFAIQSGYETYVPKTRVVLYEAGLTLSNGLGFEDALRSITLSAAEILGLQSRLGSIEKGKDADLVLFDGDPFEYTSHVCTVIINGEITNQTCK
ncbi:MAG: amidohydrolase family protein [Chloroherpetonaceae bacterium]|nr:amidohydrolase family protein [Chloroherpetonaceae bacterium]